MGFLWVAGVGRVLWGVSLGRVSLRWRKIPRFLTASDAFSVTTVTTVCRPSWFVLCRWCFAFACLGLLRRRGLCRDAAAGLTLDQVCLQSGDGPAEQKAVAPLPHHQTAGGVVFPRACHSSPSPTLSTSLQADLLNSDVFVFDDTGSVGTYWRGRPCSSGVLMVSLGSVACVGALVAKEGGERVPLYMVCNGG